MSADGVVDATIVDEDDPQYQAGYSAAVHEVGRRLGYDAVDVAAVGHDAVLFAATGNQGLRRPPRPTSVIDAWMWPSDRGRTQLRIEHVRADDRWLEVAVHVPDADGHLDGPCVNLTPDQARDVADDLRARADLVDALARARGVHTEEVPF